MKSQRANLLRVVLLASAFALLAPAGALAAGLHFSLLDKNGQGTTPSGFVRTADGNLHVAFQTNTAGGNSANGIAVVSITPSGHVGPLVQALSWGGSGGTPSGIPGLAVMPGGALEAVVGGSPSGDPGPWGISSADGGNTWSQPTDVGSGSMEAGDGNMQLQVSNGTPVFTAGCCGGIVVQQGFGPGAPTYQLTNNSDGAAGNVETALDAATGAVVASWGSNDGSGGLWLQQIAPTEGAAVKAPIPSQYGTGLPLTIAGRDSGPGVFAAYAANFGNTTHIRLLQYGGGSVGVGAVRGLHANVVGVATGPDGRLWVMWWGQRNGKQVLAVTRSNKAITRFEPIQTFNSPWAGDVAFYGDGRLGPLDLLTSGTPVPPNGQALVAGTYFARVLPELSTKVSVHKAGKGKFKLSIKVTDAGDPVAGAKASSKGHQKLANSNGVDKLSLNGNLRSRVKVTVSEPGYRSVKLKVKL